MSLRQSKMAYLQIGLACLLASCVKRPKIVVAPESPPHPSPVSVSPSAVQKATTSASSPNVVPSHDLKAVLEHQNVVVAELESRYKSLQAKQEQAQADKAATKSELVGVAQQLESARGTRDLLILLTQVVVAVQQATGIMQELNLLSRMILPKVLFARAPDGACQSDSCRENETHMARFTELWRETHDKDSDAKSAGGLLLEKIEAVKTVLNDVEGKIAGQSTVADVVILHLVQARQDLANLTAQLPLIKTQFSQVRSVYETALAGAKGTENALATLWCGLMGDAPDLRNSIAVVVEELSFDVSFCKNKLLSSYTYISSQAPMLEFKRQGVSDQRPLTGFANIKSLKLQYGNLTNWKELAPIYLLQDTRFRSLRSLDLSCNKLTTVSDEIRHFGNLENLTLDENRIAQVSEQIKALQQLRVLSLSGNQMASLSRSVWALPKLEVLKAAAAGIQEAVVTANGDCPALRTLDLSGNQIAGADLSFCDNLTEVDLSRNRITRLVGEDGRVVFKMPKSCADQSKKLTVKLDGNPICKKMDTKRPEWVETPYCLRLALANECHPPKG